ncbi:MAG: Csp1 family four helix bundle copper storage protein [Myxococcales bacterium]|jgi:Cys-rich four helix bundle protein (predicted Tat secretion target)|nr:Csp1 family four helix bundle copper storage protein [Myxococcales bacterium]MBL0198226.1 Csp1 family four helix bundle copper storage protein [Myxococcales bacterium]HQY64482.1 Csp1 family four helix bundle copper storage protein [Polyangiaceae bacterium]
MNRREALVGSSVWTAALAIGTISCAKSAVAQAADPHAHHHGGDAALVDAAFACMKAGNACLAHCIGMVMANDLSMAACLGSVSDMLATMEALSKVAARGGKRTNELAKAALGFCSDCATECQKHAAVHAVCKECMEACQRTVAAIQKLG